MRMRPAPEFDDHSGLFVLAGQAGQSPPMDLPGLISRRLLVCPECHEPLESRINSTRRLIDSSGCEFDIDGEGRPNLLPLSLQSPRSPAAMSPLELYWGMNKFRIGEGNASTSATAWRLHASRFSNFVHGLQGILLDVGCDVPSVSRHLMGDGCDYIGLDPFPESHTEFCIHGMAELLPFADSSVDNVVFNTSLDHVLDWRTAVEEAHRVLRLGGRIVVATLAWLGKATLLTDDIHYHHFRESEILDEINLGFHVEKIARFPDPTDRSHGYGLYVKATKST